MEPYLPKNTLPSKNWIWSPIELDSGPLRPFVQDFLSKERLVRRNIFEADQVQNLIEKNDKGLGDFSYILFNFVLRNLVHSFH